MQRARVGIRLAVAVGAGTVGDGACAGNGVGSRGVARRALGVQDKGA